MSAREDAEKTFICAVCSREIRPGSPLATVGGQPAHLECWLKSRRTEQNGSAAQPRGEGVPRHGHASSHERAAWLAGYLAGLTAAACVVNPPLHLN